ncbi:hypothetical protein IQ07DRAFT_579984 [Pyrenochaeta sp. DS3sAY3a]|nr:hypothetical protein IQ07DRAFT_579984 [Pyrenochaeta sp. DS3sAY3a]
MRAERLAEKKEHIEKKRQVRSLAQMVESKLLEDLSSCITAESVRATFACGDTLDCSGELESRATVDSGTLPATHTKSRQALPPVDIRFGASGEGVTLSFPHHAADSAEFQRLLTACQPASFGRGTQEVLDEKYRKAGKLDRTSFATTFCPYEAGIVDVVGQLLLPQATQDENSRSIRAELYKLNVYSAPSGKFKAHVDTPRSETQVGSLVVCLPLSHEGGQLVVRHAGNEIEFDWSDSGNEKKPSRISWAAFYSDCEHEVLEVTSGHRLTLTYNLYSIRGLGHLAGETAVLDASSLPLYQPLRQALESPGFLRQGRILAIWLTHSYPHTSTMVDLLPSALKGADMALYEAFRALNLWCKVVPVMESSYSRFYDDDRNVYLAGSKFMPFNECKNRSGNLDPEEGIRFGSEIPSRKTTWLNSQAQGGDQQAQMAYMTYGNEPGIAIHYSRAAMLVRIPPYLKRPEAERPKKFYEGIDGYDSDDEYDSYHEYDSYPI